MWEVCKVDDCEREAAEAALAASAEAAAWEALSAARSRISEKYMRWESSWLVNR